MGKVPVPLLPTVGCSILGFLHIDGDTRLFKRLGLIDARAWFPRANVATGGADVAADVLVRAS